MLKTQQTRKIYGMAAKLGILENGNKNDDLHIIVYRLTRKESIRSLNDDEYEKVVSELASMLKFQNIDEPPRRPYKTQNYENSGKGKISDGQIRKIWRLMYQLEETDIKASKAELGDRLCGIIRKELHIDCMKKQPFKWLSYQQGVKLIEILKKYLANAQRRKDGVKSKD